MISNLNAPGDRQSDVYPFNVEPTVYDLPPVNVTFSKKKLLALLDGEWVEPDKVEPVAPDGDDYTYDTRPFPTKEQERITALEADNAALRQEVKRLQADVGILSTAMLELISRIEAMEYHR